MCWVYGFELVLARLQNCRVLLLWAHCFSVAGLWLLTLKMSGLGLGFRT